MIRNVLVFLGCGMALFAASAQAQPRGGPTYREAEGVLDHFLCYRLQNPDWFPPAELGFRDQFSKDPEPAFVQRRAFLCNPVEKDDRKRLHPEAHLLCYWIEGEKAPPQVRVANQLHPVFGRVRVELSAQAGMAPAVTRYSTRRAGRVSDSARRLRVDCSPPP